MYNVGAPTEVAITVNTVDDGVDGFGVDAKDVEATQLRDEVQTIIDNAVSQSSISRYTNSIVNCLHGYLHPIFERLLVSDLVDAHGLDQAIRTEKKWKHLNNLRSVMDRAISRICCDDKNTHPLVLANLDFDIFSRYLTSRKKLMTVRRTVERNEIMENVAQVYLGKFV